MCTILTTDKRCFASLPFSEQFAYKKCEQTQHVRKLLLFLLDIKRVGFVSSQVFIFRGIHKKCISLKDYSVEAPLEVKYLVLHHSATCFIEDNSTGYRNT